MGFVLCHRYFEYTLNVTILADILIIHYQLLCHFCPDKSPKKHLYCSLIQISFCEIIAILGRAKMFQPRLHKIAEVNFFSI